MGYDIFSTESPEQLSLIQKEPLVAETFFTSNS